MSQVFAYLSIGFSSRNQALSIRMVVPGSQVIVSFVPSQICTTRADVTVKIYLTLQSLLIKVSVQTVRLCILQFR